MPIVNIYPHLTKFLVSLKLKTKRSKKKVKESHLPKGTQFVRAVRISWYACPSPQVSVPRAVIDPQTLWSMLPRPRAQCSQTETCEGPCLCGWSHPPRSDERQGTRARWFQDRIGFPELGISQLRPANFFFFFFNKSLWYIPNATHHHKKKKKKTPPYLDFVTIR